MKKEKIGKPLGVALTVFILLAALSFANFSVVSGANTATFGNTNVGNISVRFSTNKDSSRFRLVENGVIQSITAYFATSWFYAKAAIYSDNNGAPNSLITQSASQYVSLIGWQTFAVPQKSLSPGYYWLTVVSSRTRASGRAVTGSTGQHYVKTTMSYSSEFTNAFGSPNKFDSASTSIYATYVPEAPATQLAFGIYSDQSCTSKLSTLNWGIITPGTTKNLVLYIRNEGTIPITLLTQMSNWNPANTANFFTLTWDYNNQPLNTGGTLKVTLVLSASSQISGINSFSFDNTLTASG